MESFFKNEGCGRCSGTPPVDNALISWLRTQPDVVRELKKRAAGDDHKFGD